VSGPRAPGEPLVSFIVLSYNYEGYIGQTIRSILEQTERRLEIVVVDDASTDASCDVVRSFADPRVRLHVNEHNLGGAGSYNRAVGLARGEFLVNLDADDWIEPGKTELQLAAFAADPTLDVLGTHVAFVDAEGRPHPRAAELEAWTNQDHDFNLVDTWVVKNCLCRSSTMMRRSVHDRIGLDDAAMVRAPDYELWTRALRQGCRFGLLGERLTSLRMHARGVTFGDPRGTFWEISHLLLKNLVPLVEQRATYASFARMIDWITAHEQFAVLTPAERHRLLGLFLGGAGFERFEDFRAAVAGGAGGADLETSGRRLLALLASSTAQQYAEKLERDVLLFTEARDWFQREAAHWRAKSEESVVLREVRRFVPGSVRQLVPARVKRLLTRDGR
jgi:glycosyltransferase involved in cell wall biosynthesis